MLKKCPEIIVAFLTLVSSIAATVWALSHDVVLAYGDSESHINIAKRVVDSLTPGMAQLGGIWLPLPHLLMVPLVKWDFLWRTGLAGSIVSGTAYIAASVFLFRLIKLFTKNNWAAGTGTAVFAFNQNILYVQSTPLGETVLISLFVISTYYLVLFFQNPGDIPALILAAFFGFGASLSRYDGWFLVVFEAGAIFLFFLRRPTTYHELEGKLILFATLAFVGVLLWLAWDGLILGDPFYFANSPFSAKSQQNAWLNRGELPAYKNIFNAVTYYSVTAAADTGVITSVLALLGLGFFLTDRQNQNRVLLALLLSVPFLFYVATLYLGQSVIFIPLLTPSWFEWRLFNVRYGIMMVPFAAFFTGYLWHRVGRRWVRWLLLPVIIAGLYYYGLNSYTVPLTLADGTVGLSATKHPEAQVWLAQNYDRGLVLMDDYARTLSVIKSGIPMQQVIYVGNKPYWEESLIAPEKYATWIVMQKDDAVWTNIYDRPDIQGRLFKYFQKVYTSPDILVFKRIY